MYEFQAQISVRSDKGVRTPPDPALLTQWVGVQTSHPQTNY